MDAILQSQLDRVETALNTLLDSITTYNPSVPAALDLLSADTDLTRGLNQLCAHQHNHRRILFLRATASALDSHLASTLTLLASTRADLLSTPTTSIPATHRPVPYPSLLSYAKHISKFTVPPPLTQPQQPAPGTPNPDAQSPKPKSANGADTPSADAAAGDAPPERAAGLGVAALQPGEVRWLDPGAQVAWGPWPSEEVIRRGALARIQVLLEQGVDPESVERPGTINGSSI
ncbi:Mediator complex, subunit Med4 [Lasallia pustulata]|uniref:Mediator of RNA polymerase II transcription subunit 4 n=1 Tax=Lasallia pustulata TaxID=136370 RepID=A0A1W5CS57_9LECA|nr:Mediator complex, subunit Med4 [Lasallia pustulata]